MARLARSGSKGVRRAAKSQSRAAGARRAKAKTTGALDTVMGVVPLSEEQWSRVFMALILGAALLLVGTIASLAGVPALARAEFARVAGEAGYSLSTVRVTGTERMDEAQVYALAMQQQNRPMPDIDIVELRERIKRLEWVEDARVSIQLPDTLAIDIVERVPHALLEKPGGLILIDRTGQELPSSAPEQADERMMRVSGDGVAKRMPDLDALFAAAPAIEEQVEVAEWVGNRRWDFTFATGQVLMLPEGKLRASKALTEFAKLDGQYRLIGGKVVRIDMRDLPRVYMREPGRADRYEFAAGGA
ncbi:MAG: FtsQ-type POTRA domain-containing protein [Erythrobacter sp.]|uniref:cell division protein FtsQ/DivIB n=1 Tax=Erythrobacter sp. TaxID=1042 RepID=UPI0026203999|nr:FtsQ-type POTRA domain-containing protein [Erythrobacter sp.]MDJ0979914.1 FtsQ-type POTRA domain-containing protein [Erythrobacter sp.]